MRWFAIFVELKTIKNSKVFFSQLRGRFCETGESYENALCFLVSSGGSCHDDSFSGDDSLDVWG